MFSAARALLGRAPAADETTNPQFDKQQAEFLSVDAQLVACRAAVAAFLGAAAAMTEAASGVSEALVPLLSPHVSLREEACEYLNAVTGMSTAVAGAFSGAVNHAVLRPLDTVLRSHAELKLRCEERRRAVGAYREARAGLRALQKKERGSSAAKRAKAALALTRAHTTYHALTDALGDEFTVLGQRRGEVRAFDLI